MTISSGRFTGSVASASTELPAAANAAYDYVLAILFVDREISHFRNLDDSEAKRDFERRLNEFVMMTGTARDNAGEPLR